MSTGKLRAHTFYLWPRLGWTSVLGAVLLLAALWIEAVLVPDLQAQASQAKQVVQTARVVRPPTAAEMVQERQKSWLSGLPQSHVVPNVVESIHSAARLRGVRLERGEYRWVQDPTPQFFRYEMVFPVQGRYAELRSWLADSLNANPSLALDGMSVARHTLTAQDLDGTIRLTLYTKSK